MCGSIVAQLWGLHNPAMTGTKVFIDQEVLDPVDASKPPAMSRVAWVNYLLMEGMAAVKQRNKDRDA